ncbi:hypothetical protein PENSPDRAFT_647167 [Peniophora sp. CONT]|nr:hypothetical protein PENSPDRAFT_647167 [Peniophora sp. CONT]
MATQVIDLTDDTSDIEEINSVDFARTNATTEGKGSSRRERKRKRSGQDAGQDQAVEVKDEAGQEGTPTARKSRRKKNKSARSSPAPAPAPVSATPNLDDLFFVDTAPAPIPQDLAFFDAKPASAPSSSSSTEESAYVKTPETPALLLPAHVSVLAENANGKPIEIIRPPSPLSEGEDVEGFIQILDYDDRPTDLARYFEKPEDEKRRVVCKRCGAEGEHTTGECTLKICMTCGVRGEHTTFGCPISKTCHTCGMKGHLRQNCPNRNKSRQMMDNSYNDCDRCGSSKHQTVECPTHWRMYEYVSEAERHGLLEARARLSELKLGEGGEAYIATDEWCYNCGEAGHLGDDCESTFMEGCPTIPSAFGAYNTMSGPFYDATQPSAQSSARPPREWEDGGDLMDGWGFSAPAQVGQRAKKDKKQKMAKAWQDKQEREDEDDWFSNPKNARSRGMGNGSASGSGSGAAGAGKKKAPMFVPTGKLSLFDRIESADAPPSNSRQSSDRRDRDRDRDRGRDRGGQSSGQGSRNRDKSSGGGYQSHKGSSYQGGSSRDRDRDWDRGKRRGGGGGGRRDDYDRRDRDRRDDRHSSGPRYHGGYR